MAEQKSSREARVPVRTKTTGDPPRLAQIIINHYAEVCKESGRCYVSFVVDTLPISVNHQYVHTRFNTRLKPEVHEFRARVKQSMGEKAARWKPIGTTAAVVVMQSPYWITKKRRIQRMDADNKIKPIFDAVEECTGAEDERHWNFHVFKIYSKRERLNVYLFDLGDVVEYYY